MRNIRWLLLLASLLIATTPAASRDGSHDFAFEDGTWTIDGGPCCYRHIVRTLWDGASLAQLQAQNPTPHFTGLMMRLYGTMTGTWSVYWTKAGTGTFDAPLIGTFENGRGVFTAGSQRIVYSNITPTSFRTEEQASADSGKTWATTLTQNFTRVANANIMGDGGHDFDFLLGSWRTHIAYWNRSNWVHITGTVVNRNLWDGNGDIEEILSPSLQGMTMRLYDARSHEWSLYWANRRDGTVGAPMVGHFAGGVGDFYNQETDHGHTVFLHQRYVTSPSNGYHFEQSESSDGGQSWKPNFVADLTRLSSDASEPASAPIPAFPVAQHGFDWQFGSWNIHMSRRLRPLAGSTARIELNGTVVLHKIWSGAANYAMIDAHAPTRRYEFLALRMYLPQSKQWTLSFASKGDGALSDPMYGGFTNGQGDFYGMERVDGKMVLGRFRFFPSAARTAHDDEAVSDDGGKTWVNEWLNTHTKLSP
ncbi:MAG TPA: hypothetical protein VMT95_03265 [Candidatus Binatia bacterium]|nr:hypothetical protein [Candidatus Binatia bacterium]